MLSEEEKLDAVLETTDLDYVEELEHDSRDASEKGRSCAAFHLMGEAFDFDERPDLLAHILLDARWIERIHGWEKQCRQSVPCFFRGT